MSESSSAAPQSRDQSEYTLRSIGFSELMFFVQTTQVAIGLFNLPRVVVEEANHSGWIAVLLAGCATQLAALIIVLLLRRFRNKGFYEILKSVYGKWIGTFIGLLFALYCIAAAALVSRSYIETVQSWLFPTSTTKGFYLLVLVPTVYLATGGARVLARFGVITFFGTSWMLLLLYAPISKIQPIYYLPIWDTSFLHIMKATWSVSASMVGFEILLVAFPYVQPKKKVLLASSLGIWITTTIYLIVVLVSIGFYSQEQLKATISPTLDMYQVVELPMIQRIEHIGISTWSFLVVGTVAAYLWAAGRFVFDLTKAKWKETWCIYACTPVLYASAVWPQDMLMLTKFESFLGTAGFVASVCLPTFVLLSAIVLRKKAPPPQQQQQQEGAAS